MRIGSTISSQCTVENGTPQGSAISPLLFVIMINDVFSDVPEGIGRSLFADDGVLWKKGRNIEHLVGKVQEAVNMVVEWGFDWGFRFSVEKTKMMFFTKRTVSETLQLKLYDKVIGKVSSFKYLGVVFDSRLTWREHIDRIETKCKKVVNVMRCVAGRGWGASSSALKRLYQALIRSVFDYGCVAYGSAARSVLRCLDVLQSEALRVCCGAFKTSPVSALQVEMGEMPLDLRRTQVSVNYWVHLGGHGDAHPTKEVRLECWEYGRSQKDHFGKVGNQWAKECHVYELKICPAVVFPVVPPWLLETPPVDWYLLDLKRKLKGRVDLVSAFHFHSLNEYPGCIHVFTDGAKSPDTGITGFGIAVPSKNIEINRRTSDGLAVYTVEMVAILVALKWIECSKLRQVVVCSDSAAVLSSLQSFCSKTRQGMLFTILETISRIRCCGGNIHFLWVPAHVGISGNEKVDRLAKGALAKHRTEMEIKSSGSEAKGIVWRQVVQEWQERWDSGSKGRHLYHFKKEVAGCRLYRGNRREEVVITRLRLGHCALNKTLQMIGKHETGLCGVCQEEEETVEHVILRCKGYDVERKVLQTRLKERGIGEFNLKSVLEGSRAQVRELVGFLKAIGVYERV